jgi:hypothetical protein
MDIRVELRLQGNLENGGYHPHLLASFGFTDKDFMTLTLFPQTASSA